MNVEKGGEASRLGIWFVALSRRCCTNWKWGKDDGCIEYYLIIVQQQQILQLYFYSYYYDMLLRDTSNNHRGDWSVNGVSWRDIRMKEWRKNPHFCAWWMWSFNFGRFCNLSYIESKGTLLFIKINNCKYIYKTTIKIFTCLLKDTLYIFVHLSFPYCGHIYCSLLDWSTLWTQMQK